MGKHDTIFSRIQIEFALRVSISTIHSNGEIKESSDDEKPDSNLPDVTDGREQMPDDKGTRTKPEHKDKEHKDKE